LCTNVHLRADGKSDAEREGTMLWTLFVILLLAWLVGLIGFHVVAWYIHLLLVVALVVLVLQLVSGRRPVV
jgi:Flp pilus assembly protein TadB